MAAKKSAGKAATDTKETVAPEALRKASDSGDSVAREQYRQVVQTKRREEGEVVVGTVVSTKNLSGAESEFERLQREEKEQRGKDFQERLKSLKDQKVKVRKVSREKEEGEAETVLYIDNPTDETFEVQLGGDSYYIVPGENEIADLGPNWPAQAVASFIHGRLVSRGVTFRSENPMRAKKAGAPKDAEGVVDAIMQNTTTGGAMKFPDAQYEGIAFTTNPAADERAQPVRFQESGPMDPKGENARRIKESIVRSEVTGELPDEVGPEKQRALEQRKSVGGEVAAPSRSILGGGARVGRSSAPRGVVARAKTALKK